MNKRLFLIVLWGVLLALVPPAADAQILKPVKWTFTTREIAAGEVQLIFTATIDRTWHLYSQDVPPPPDGPVATSFTFGKSSNYKLVGKVTEPKAIEEYDKQFEATLKYFTDKAVFKQTIKVTSATDFKLNGFLEFMCCDDKQCLAPETVDFEFKIKGNTATSATPTAPTETTTTAVTPADSAQTTPVAANSITKTDSTTAEINPVSDGGLQKNESLWTLFFFSFLAGLAAILTPCVFPMIPMTVTFFLKEQDKVKAKTQALVYGISIILIYTIIGTLVAVTLGANFANFLSTHWLPNVLFFLIFLFFAASFLGMFEITLPSWMINKSDAQADRGGIIGSFFMAFTLVLVSFSCTGPIVGAILVASAGGQVLEPIVGMLGFSLAFALPFPVCLFPALAQQSAQVGRLAQFS